MIYGQFLIFAPAPMAGSRRSSLTIYSSVLLHVLLLAWLIHSPAATFISPSSIMRGENGSSVTRIYWPAQLAKAGGSESPGKDRGQHPTERSAGDRLTWSQAQQRRPAKPAVAASDVASDNSSARANPAPLAGSVFGSLSYGSMSGQEVRPAIRVSGSEPLLGGLSNIAEGNEIIELTIDEQGNIIQKIVVQSLGPAVDDAVLAALQNWHFRPATRD